MAVAAKDSYTSPPVGLDSPTSDWGVHASAIRPSNDVEGKVLNSDSQGALQGIRALICVSNVSVVNLLLGPDLEI